ncbi:MAG: hypothetical protein ACREH4_05815 [Vitreimonas sp.]
MSPNLNVYSSYADRLPGEYLLYVNTSALSTVVRPTGLACAAHSYPLDAQDVFRVSALRTMQQLVENVQLVDRPISGDALVRAGKAGMIIVHAESLSARIIFIEGFFSSTGEGSVDLAASIAVNTPAGRVLGTSAGGDSTQQAPAGSACEGGAEAIGRATEMAMREVLGQLGERMSNSTRLRQPIAAVSPGS